ncbi:MAG: transglycosylase domain-containing protein [Bacillus sp. (in: firmicutes)]
MADEYQTREERRKKSKEKKRKSKNKSQKPKKGLFKKVLLTLVALFVLGLVVGIGTFAYYVSSTPEIDEALLKDPVSSKIYASSTGELIGEVGTEKRDYVNFEEIPDLVVDAVLATEDARFYEHNGVDLLRLGGAVIANFTDGFGSQGASTITQQLVKRSFLTDEKTLKRKAQELWLSLQIERKYSKEEIFEMYINKIFYGQNANGIAKAAEIYFGKTLDELDLAEAATLAGLPQSPTNYNPFNYPERAEKRRNVVLSLMHKHGYITESEMKEAQAVPIEDYLLPEDERGTGNSSVYDAFIDLVIEEVQEKTDYNPYTDGLEIYTTLDPDAQEYVYDVLNTDEYISYPSDEFQAGITLLDTTTGKIRAIGGGRNQTVSRGFNYATDIERQPGSTIKPILDYGPAIEYLKWSTYEQIVDEATTYSDGTPINNWNNRYQGQMSIRTALAKSLNIPALKAMQAVGLEKSKAFGESLGLEFKDGFYESYSIGGFSTGISPLTLAGAYSAFGNEGIYNEPYTVEKIVLQDKTTTIDLTPESEVVMQDYTAFMISDMLKTVVTSGTGTEANIPGLPVAGKTGTTNYTDEERAKWGITDSAAVPDSWFVGYTTQYTMAVWTGYENKSEYLGKTSQSIAKKLFKNIMSHVSEDVKTKDFKQPNSVQKVGVEIGSNPAKLPSANTPSDQITYEYFVKGTVPTEVSQSYDKLDAPTGLNAAYNAETNEIVLTWSYPESEDKKATFNATVSIDGGAAQTIASGTEKTATVSNAAAGSVYKFSVTATVGSQQSDPASVTIQVPAVEEEDEEESIEDEMEGLPEEDDETSDGETETPDQSDDTSGNNNGNTNNNNNNSGNGNNSSDTGNTNPGNGNNNGSEGQGNSNTNEGNNGSSPSDVQSDQGTTQGAASTLQQIFFFRTWNSFSLSKFSLL